MTDTGTRQVLEEAWERITVRPPSYALACRDDSNSDETLRQLGEQVWDWAERKARFTRFLDAEAWTDAALCLVPEGKCWHIRYDPRLTGATVMDQDGFNQHHTLAETPALALLEACLEARENADG